MVSSGMFYVQEQLWVDIHMEIHVLVRVTQEFNGLLLTDEEYVKLQHTYSLVGMKTFEDIDLKIQNRQALRLDKKKSFDNTTKEWSLTAYLNAAIVAVENADQGIEKRI
jgi:hypothetical protein